MSPTYAQAQAFESSITNPAEFWGTAAREISWIRSPTDILYNDPARETNPYTWFKGGLLNTCQNAVDRHAAADSDRIAIIYHSPVTDTRKSFTYGELLDEVQVFAGVLRSYDVRKGDTVLPMIPQAVITMLACARIGAVHSVVFGGFAPKELAKRIDDCKPKVIVSASYGVEPTKIISYKPMLDTAITHCSYKPPIRIIYQRPYQQPASLNLADGDRDWTQEVRRVRDKDAQVRECVPVESGDPLYILYTSGTTGVPKGVVRENGGHAVALLWTMKYLFGIKKGETFFCASDIGYIIYGPLLYGITTVLYEGKPIGTPDAGAFWRVVAEYGVSAMFTAPTAMRAIRSEDPEGKRSRKYNIRKTLKAIFLAGERSDPGTIDYCQDIVGEDAKVVDNYWSTEIGSPITATCLGFPSTRALVAIAPLKPGSAGTPVPGNNVRVILDETHEEATGPGQFGNIVLKLPLPPTAFPGLWNNPKGYAKSYFERFPGYLDTGDAGIVDEEGYVHIMSRTDDIINVAGHRLSTGSVEQVLSAHPAIAECCVIPIPDALKGHKPLGIVVVKHTHPSLFNHSNDPETWSTLPPKLMAEMVQAMCRDIGAIACFEKAVVVKRLPKTRSGKVLRRCIRDMVEGKEVIVPATIEDEEVIREVSEVLKNEGLLPGKKHVKAKL
ncbi:hypothetical protein BC937DRAFT_94967 [Endogone sp. FLAS-F59071]|nr:hypothetical protein BC937DRAFT_94967 [Endogone sp. FLAS-F59071]|eukprot:RUS22918.1 hypothetical protein BC937DRAFT_94967 [Endogone sp. FLAS-F59071]